MRRRKTTHTYINLSLVAEGYGEVEVKPNLESDPDYIPPVVEETNLETPIQNLGILRQSITLWNLSSNGQRTCSVSIPTDYTSLLLKLNSSIITGYSLGISLVYYDSGSEEWISISTTLNSSIPETNISLSDLPTRNFNLILIPYGGTKPFPVFLKPQ